MKKEKKNNPNPAFRKRKALGVPNSLPFKEAVLKEAEDRKFRLEEERKKQKEKRKQDRDKLLNKKRSLDGLVKDAQKKNADFERKQMHQTSSADTYKSSRGMESTLKTFYKEFRKVVDAADVILEVLDARDPLGSRCREMEELILSSSTDKRLVLVLNKIDLIPRENVEAWLKYLRNEYPVVAFKASTQSQHSNLCRIDARLTKANQDMLRTSHCLGADILMKLLKNYCRNKDVKTMIRVGVVGFPNTGKSSIINSLKRSKACYVGATPGITRQMQEVILDKQIRLLDSPGVVMATATSDTAMVLKNCVRLEAVEDITEPVEAILKRCNKQQMMLRYCIPNYDTPAEFLSVLAQRLGKFKKGGTPDINKAARTVLRDWNNGKIRYYTHPPEMTSTHVGAEFVSQMGKEFDIDALLADQQKIVNSLEQQNSKHILVESLGPTEAVVKPEDLHKLNKTAVQEDDKEMQEDEELEEEEEEAEMSSEEEEEGLHEEEEAMEGSDEEEELAKVTVSPLNEISRTSSQSSSRGEASKKKKGEKEERLNPGLPQLNKARKMDFKKMKKERRRRDRVAGELSDALTSAFALTGAGNQRNDGEDGYDFGAHF